MFILAFDKLGFKGRKIDASSLDDRDFLYLNAVKNTFVAKQADATKFENIGELLAACITFSRNAGQIPEDDRDGYHIVEVA